VVFCGEAQLGMMGKVVGKAAKVKWVIYDGEQRADQVRLVTSPLGISVRVADPRTKSGRLGVGQSIQRCT
jgi:hypothetical protein